MYKYTKAYSGEDNIEFEEKDIFITQVPLGDILADVTKDVTKDVSPQKRQEMILEQIGNSPEITIHSLAEQLGVNEKTIKREMAILKKERKIYRVNGKKYGYWKILELVPVIIN